VEGNRDLQTQLQKNLSDLRANRGKSDRKFDFSDRKFKFCGMLHVAGALIQLPTFSISEVVMPQVAKSPTNDGKTMETADRALATVLAPARSKMSAEDVRSVHGADDERKKILAARTAASADFVDKKGSELRVHF